MSYIDYNMAGLEERELFSCGKTAVEKVYAYLAASEGVLGSVLIATCNRTELYLSLEDGAEINPFEKLCEALGYEYGKYKHINRTIRGEAAIIHLSRVAAGAESQIWGDYQIVTQVGDAIRQACELKASDSILNVAFRTGITAGKKVKTLVDFNVNDNSTASRAARIIAEDSEIRSALVIGNGMIGRAVAEELTRAGIKTTMTLRQYRHGEIVIPKGVGTVNYNERNSVIRECDAVVSATMSPHYTVHYEEIKDFDRLPKIFIDLAVPRDIEPKIGEIDGVLCYNVDDISRDVRDRRQKEQLEYIDEIIEKYIKDFRKWHSYKKSLEEQKIKGTVGGIE